MFKVGDIVRGNKLSDGYYEVTNSHMKRAMVIDMNPGWYIVKILQHDYPEFIGQTFYMKTEYAEAVG